MGLKRINPDRILHAYIIGLAVGDGNLSNPNGRALRLRISCDTKYPFLIAKIKRNLELLLPDNIVSLAPKQGNCVDVSCYSNYWGKLLGWTPTEGSKLKQKVSVPAWILADSHYMTHCLRGLIETDGCIYRDRGYPMVGFVSAIERLAQDALCMISILGFTPRIYKIMQGPYTKYHVRVSKDVEKFLDVVRPEKR